MTNEAQNPKSKRPHAARAFELRASAFFHHSSFGFWISFSPGCCFVGGDKLRRVLVAEQNSVPARRELQRGVLKLAGGVAPFDLDIKHDGRVQFAEADVNI